ncbi:spermidine synthase [candidate division CSSED10-310 bacterium]|uniref:Spermidine synthase n=1 Tax=candidate division CSSED10-310 bacterium TaxID=2855610 RepID=A0ABV6Z175_UNCC1
MLVKPAMGQRKKIIELFLISFLGLYLEMLVIRWLSANVRIMAYYTNVVLITSFLGLSLGALRARMKITTFYLFPYIVLLLIVSACFFGEYHIVKPEQAEEFWSSLVLHSSSLHLYYVLLIVTVLNIFTFIPIGQLTGRLLAELPPILGYSVNISGSIIGILCFALISFLQLSPPVWFLISFLVAAYFLRKKLVLFLSGSSALILSLVIIFIFDKEAIWSPYYRLVVEERTIAPAPGQKQGTWYQLNVNTDIHQCIFDLRDDAPKDDILRRSKSFYEAPYQFSALDNVLIIGSGSGNDVAGAIRRGAKRIEAVEIDPVIVALGKKLHPEKPYQQPKVNVHINDARSFLKHTDQKFDLVVFGFLDSQRLFSHMSNLRLDSYIYTVECFQEVLRCLKPDGVCAISFAVTKPWIFDRFLIMIREAFRTIPLVYEKGGACLFVIAPNRILVPQEMPHMNLLSVHDIQRIVREVPPATDDWPFLYLEKRAIPIDYVKMLVTLFLLSAVLVLLFNPARLDSQQIAENQMDLREDERVNNTHFFFLGAAFMLLETKSITELSLIFGSTWIVITVVVTSILLMILGANLLVSFGKFSNRRIAYLLLFLSILANYFIPLHFFLSLPSTLKFVISSCFITVPLFFAGIIFINSFRKSANRDIAFGANILGAVLGGLFEYVSLSHGFRSLYLFVLLFYLCSYAALIYKKSTLSARFGKLSTLLHD